MQESIVFHAKSMVNTLKRCKSCKKAMPFMTQVWSRAISWTAICNTANTVYVNIFLYLPIVDRRRGRRVRTGPSYPADTSLTGTYTHVLIRLFGRKIIPCETFYICCCRLFRLSRQSYPDKDKKIIQ